MQKRWILSWLTHSQTEYHTRHMVSRKITFEESQEVITNTFKITLIVTYENKCIHEKLIITLSFALGSAVNSSVKNSSWINFFIFSHFCVIFFLWLNWTIIDFDYISSHFGEKNYFLVREALQALIGVFM
jgi:hypothetical protein